MPELPEVETVKRIIGPQIKGRIISDIRMNRPEIISHPQADTFYDLVKGREIEDMSRRGKYLSILLDNDDTIRLHLRMSGHLLVTPHDFEEEKHTHIIFDLDNGNELRFIDTRRFGRFWLIKNGEEDTYSGVSKLGPEPFDSDFTVTYLQDKLARRNKSIKECLLEQNVIAGIGNIYGDEILYVSGINPKRPASSLKNDEWAKLAESIPAILAKAIEDNSLSPEEYLKSKGKDYRSTPFFKVYGHAGEPCPVCSTPLQRIVLSGRSSVFCPKCQK